MIPVGEPELYSGCLLLTGGPFILWNGSGASVLGSEPFGTSGFWVIMSPELWFSRLQFYRAAVFLWRCLFHGQTILHGQILIFLILNASGSSCNCWSLGPYAESNPSSAAMSPSGCFLCIISTPYLQLFSSFAGQAVLLHFCGRENWDSDRFINLFEVTEPVSGPARTYTSS